MPKMSSICSAVSIASDVRTHRAQLIPRYAYAALRAAYASRGKRCVWYNRRQNFEKKKTLKKCSGTSHMAALAAKPKISHSCVSRKTAKKSFGVV